MQANEDWIMIQSALQDPRKFSGIYAKYFPSVFRYVTAHAGHNDAEDLTQTIFLRVVERLHSFKGSAPFVAWLFTIARHAIIDFYRKRSNQRSEMEFDQMPDQGSSNGNTTIENQLLISGLLKQLSDTERELITLRFFGDLSAHEIGLILNMSDGAVRTGLYRALRKLRDIWNNEGGTGI